MRIRKQSDDDALVGGDGGVAVLEPNATSVLIPSNAKQDSLLTRILRFEITPKKVPRKDLMHFSRQLAVFVAAGIPITDALESISEEMGNKQLKAVIIDIRDRLQAGETLASAVTEHSEAFPAFYTGVLKTAELTGTLDSALLQLSDYIERDLEARRKITSALTYPAVVLAFSLIVVVVLTTFVLPRFEDFFQGLNAKLPLATRILLDTSHFFRHWWWIFAGVAAVALLGALAAVRTEGGRRAWDRILLRLPVLGDLVHHAILERFCRVLSAMVTAGVPLPEAMRVTGAATGNVVFKEAMDEARESMMRGEGLATPLAASGLFPAAAKQMFRVGEDTGSLDNQLQTAAEYFDRELDYKIKRFTNLFEPAVILFVGLIVGFVAIALVSAMYGIFRQVQV
jgi:type IV pilus assembly protein PilC